MKNNLLKIKNYILNNATTGVLTDYFDEKKISYNSISMMEVNIPNNFILGKIKTIICESGNYKDERIQAGLGYLDQCSSEDILVVKGSQNYAYFGELMSRLCKKRKIKGAVIFGKTRDVRFTDKYLTVFSKGYTPVDIKGRGRVKSVGKDFKINNIIISESKFIACDKDGVVIFKTKDLNGLLFDIFNILSNEKNIIKMINNGSSVKEILKKTKSF